MSLLIERNGELIDKVEMNFDDAVSYEEQAEVVMQDTKKVMQKNDKISCCIMIAMMIVIVLVVCWLFKLF